MAKDDDYRRGEGDEEAAAEAPGAPRKRLAWIDWCRTQSVYNVVCGHAWWGALDAMPKAVKDACKPFCGWQGYVDAAGRPLVSETTRMVDYTVDIGALHTVPMFFLCSGLLSSISSKGKGGNENFLGFLRRRLVRLMVPFLGGFVVYFVVKVVLDEKENDDCMDHLRATPCPRKSIGKMAYDTVVSHLWFMWALTICQLLHFPIGVACRRLMGGQADALYLGGALISALVWAVLGSEVGVGAAEILSHGYMAHVLPLPLATLAMLVGSAVGGGGQPWGPALATVASIGLSFVIFEPKLHGTDEYDWLSDNVYAAFSFILLSYSIGHYIADHSQALTAAWARCKVPKGSFAVLVILLSSYWPMFATYWGEATGEYTRPPRREERRADKKTARRNAFLITYTDGGQRIWGVIRSWVWMGGTIWFAKAACDHFVLPGAHGDPLFWHKHLHAFTLVLYIFHYPVQDVFKSMYATSGGIGDDPVSLCFRFIALNFTVVFLLYVIFSLTPPTRFVFGIPASVVGPPGGKRGAVFGAQGDA